MKYESIADVFSANKKFREDLSAVLGQISPDEAAKTPDGEKWSIQQVAEHVSMVDFGLTRICSKLLAAAKLADKSSDGTLGLTPEFGTRVAGIAGMRLEAPERVQPTGNVTIAETLERMAGNEKLFDAMRDDFERFDHSGETFPHPFLGDLTAGEWLVMAGLHQKRHAKQIEDLAAKVRQ